MVTLADLWARNTVPSWQQAVALVQELLVATEAERGSAARLPDIGHIGLHTDGTIALLPHSSIPENPVRHLAVLLGVLLEGVPAPGPLLDLTERNLKDPPEFAVPDDLMRALRYFERPGRDEDIKELAVCAERAREQKPIEEALRHLEERARELLEAKQLPERHVLERDGTVLIVKRDVELGRGPRLPAVSTMEVPGLDDVPAVRSRWDVHGTVRLLIVVTTLAFAAYWVTNGSAPSGPTSVEEKVAAAARRVFGEGAGGGAGVSGPSADRPPTSTLPSAGPSTGSTGTSSAASSSGRTATASSPASAPAAGASGSGSSGGSGGGRAAPATAPLPAVEAGSLPPVTAQDDSGAAGDATFSGSDADVTPPVLLGREPPPLVAGAPAATYQLIVDASGDVEQVQLLSGERGVRESMMRAHVKSWKFRPAMRRGEPVRYRMQVRVAI